MLRCAHLVIELLTCRVNLIWRARILALTRVTLYFLEGGGGFGWLTMSACTYLFIPALFKMILIVTYQMAIWAQAPHEMSIMTYACSCTQIAIMRLLS